jgi:HAE1 family hydrophobic/amphiphilic exporter-1
MISRFFIERPVLANVLAFVFVLIGLVALIQLPTAQHPNVVPPTVQVTTIYPGASARTLVDTVALPIEQQVNGVEDMIYMQSTSASDGTYTLTVTFAIGADPDKAQILVQNRVATALASLPQPVQIQGVTTQKRSTSILEFVTLVSPDSRFDSLFLSNYAVISVQNELARLNGVGNVTIFGAGQYAMRVWMNPDLLQARSLTPQDVIAAIQQQSQEVTGGQAGAPPAPNGQDFQYTLNLRGRLDEAAEFENIIVKVNPANGGEITRIRDIGRVELGAQTYSESFNLDGQPAAGIAIFLLPDANAIAVADEVKAKMDELAKSFPQGLTYLTPYDTTKFVRAAINEVYRTLFEAFGLVLIVILVFLQDWRAMLVPVTTVPVTIIGAFAAMAALGFTINLATMFAIVLAIGIVVDDAIVIVEGVSRYVEQGIPGRQAAERAMDELMGPVIGITLVLMAVFLPAAFLPGLSGQLYRQFALVIAATALISAINAVTLKPTQSAMWLRPPIPVERRNLFYRGFNAGYGAIERVYARLIGAMTRRSGAMVVLALVLIGVAVLGLGRVPAAFLPGEDQGYLIVGVQLPGGASKQRTDAVMRQISEITRDIPGVDHVVTVSGVSILDNFAHLTNAGVAFVILKGWDTRLKEKGQEVASIQRRLNGALPQDVPGAAAFAVPPPPIQGIGNVSGFTMQVEIKNGDFDYSLLESLAGTVVSDGNAQSALQRLTTTFRADAPELNVTVNRIKAETLGITVGNVFLPCPPTSDRPTSAKSTSSGKCSRSIRRRCQTIARASRTSATSKSRQGTEP